MNPGWHTNRRPLTRNATTTGFLESRTSARRADRLYAASADDLLELLRTVPEQISSVLLIGHNPGLEELGLQLTRPSPERDNLQAKFPTAALATLELTSSRWDELGPGCASLIAYVRPRDLDR